MSRPSKARVIITYILPPLYFLITFTAAMSHVLKRLSLASVMHAIVGFACYFVAYLAVGYLIVHGKSAIVFLRYGAFFALRHWPYRNAIKMLLVLMACAVLADTFGYWPRVFGYPFSAYGWVMVGAVISAAVPRAVLAAHA
jgi:hypothetical protein